MKWVLVCLGVCLLSGGAVASASIAVLLEEPYGEMGRMNPTGHSAVYFDHICADSTTMLRSCREGELGAVISRYDGIDGYDWLAVPLVPYLYAVDSQAEIPRGMDRVTLGRLRDKYRREHLRGVAPDLPDGGAPGGNWYELAGAAYDRTIYGFQVKTTAEQDASLIAMFNDRGNVQRYNGAFRNCADFTRVTLNRFYPHVVRRNLIADFGLTTPKSVARGLTRYARKHPEAGLQIFKIAQVQGELPRSEHPQGIAEGLLKKYGLGMALLSPATTAVVTVAYLGQGRFALPTHAPVLELGPDGTMFSSVVVAAVPVGRLPVELPAPATDVATRDAASSLKLVPVEMDLSMWPSGEAAAVNVVTSGGMP